MEKELSPKEAFDIITKAFPDDLPYHMGCADFGEFYSFMMVHKSQVFEEGIFTGCIVQTVNKKTGEISCCSYKHTPIPLDEAKSIDLRPYMK